MKEKHFIFSPNYQDPDVPFLLLDEDRVYNCPMIGDANMDFAVTEKDKRYAEFVKNLNSIGRGVIKFENISETWKLEERIIEISFKYNGKLHTISQTYFGEYFDWSFPQLINNIIKDSGYEIGFYHIYEIDAWNGVILILNFKEKQALKERGWKIYTSEEDFKGSREELEEIYNERLCDEWEEEAFGYWDEGKLDETLELFERILKYKSDSTRYWRYTAQVLMLQGKNEEAEKYLKKSIEISENWLKEHPDADYSYYNMACAYSLLKNKDKMLENLKNAIDMNVNNIKVAKTRQTKYIYFI